MPRLNRAASQQRTRRALLRTAREMFLQDGYFATSIDRVAEAAGYSKGAVYSNFAGKEELCLAVLDRVVADRATELAGLLAAAPGFAARLDALERWLDDVTTDRGWMALEIELASQLRQSPTLRAAFATRAAALRTALARLIEAGAAESGTPLSAPAEELAAGIVGMALGLALQRTLDPAVPVRPLVEAIRRVVEGAVGRPAPEGGDAPADARFTPARTDPARV